MTHFTSIHGGYSKPCPLIEIWPKNLLSSQHPGCWRGMVEMYSPWFFFLLAEIRRRVQQSLIFACHQECCHSARRQWSEGDSRGDPRRVAVESRGTETSEQQDVRFHPVSADECLCDFCKSTHLSFPQFTKCLVGHPDQSS